MFIYLFILICLLIFIFGGGNLVNAKPKAETGNEAAQQLGESKGQSSPQEGVPAGLFEGCGLRVWGLGFIGFRVYRARGFRLTKGQRCKLR